MVGLTWLLASFAVGIAGCDNEADMPSPAILPRGTPDVISVSSRHRLLLIAYTRQDSAAISNLTAPGFAVERNPVRRPFALIPGGRWEADSSYMIVFEELADSLSGPPLVTVVQDSTAVLMSRVGDLEAHTKWVFRDGRWLATNMLLKLMPREPIGHHPGR